MKGQNLKFRNYKFHLESGIEHHSHIAAHTGPCPHRHTSDEVIVCSDYSCASRLRVDIELLFARILLESLVCL